MKLLPVFLALLTGGLGDRNNKGRKRQGGKNRESKSEETGVPRTCHDIFEKNSEKCQSSDNGFYQIKVGTNSMTNICDTYTCRLIEFVSF